MKIQLWGCGEAKYFLSYDWTGGSALIRREIFFSRRMRAAAGRPASRRLVQQNFEGTVIGAAFRIVARVELSPLSEPKLRQATKP
jgi:hypothetical protein